MRWLDEEMRGPVRATTLYLPAGDAGPLEAVLEVPPSPRGLVLFAHGSGSSRHSPRNRAVAALLHEAGIATLLVDLLSEREGLSSNRVFDIGLLARRLQAVTAWVSGRADLADLPLGYFGASTGAAAALQAAAEAGPAIAAVVCRGGRIDLADAAARARVTAPTLCIVGALDSTVLELNATALRDMRAIRELVIVPGAGHLFEEPGALHEVSRLAGQWFARYFEAARRRRERPSSAFAAASINLLHN